MTIINQLQSAKNASHDLALFTSTKKNTILLAVAKALRHNVSAILRANRKDLVAVPVDYLLTDRLTLTAERIEHIAHSIEAVVRLPDPVGEVLGKTQRLSGLHIERRRVPL